MQLVNLDEKVHTDFERLRDQWERWTVGTSAFHEIQMMEWFHTLLKKFDFNLHGLNEQLATDLLWWTFLLYYYYEKEDPRSLHHNIFSHMDERSFLNQFLLQPIGQNEGWLGGLKQPLEDRILMIQPTVLQFFQKNKQLVGL
jgi:hypothetical protein